MKRILLIILITILIIIAFYSHSSCGYNKRGVSESSEVGTMEYSEPKWLIDKQLLVLPVGYELHAKWPDGAYVFYFIKIISPINCEFCIVRKDSHGDVIYSKYRAAYITNGDSGVEVFSEGFAKVYILGGNVLRLSEGVDYEINPRAKKNQPTGQEVNRAGQPKHGEGQRAKEE